MVAQTPAAALGSYVISMAGAPSDVLAVQLLLKETGLRRPMRVVPLFETLSDLQRAGPVIDRLLALPATAVHMTKTQLRGYNRAFAQGDVSEADWPSPSGAATMSRVRAS